jgi:hypothetical protein
MKKRILRCFPLLFLFSFAGFSQADTAGTFKKSLSFFFRRDVVEAFGVSAEYRTSPKHACEFSAGLKTPFGLFSLPVLALDYDIWTRLNGPRISFMYRTYGRGYNSHLYFGPGMDAAYLLYRDGDFHACTHCGESVNINLSRTDIAIKLIGGVRKKLWDINIGLGVRAFYVNTKIIHYVPSGGLPPLTSNGAYNDAIGKEFFRAPQAGILNGLYWLPAVQFVMAFGGRFTH